MTQVPLHRPQGLRLVFALLLVFSLLVIPALFFVLGFSYYQASETVRDQLDEALGRAQAATTDSINQTFTPLLRETLVLSRLAAIESALEDGGGLREVIRDTMANSDDLLNLVVRLENGFFYGIEWIMPELRARHPEYPADAVWIAEFRFGNPDSGSVSIEQAFFDEDMHKISSKMIETGSGFMDEAVYEGAKNATTVFSAKSSDGPLSNLPSLSFSVPVRRGDVFIGAVIGHVLLDDISTDLRNARISEHSESIILGPDGQVLAASDLSLLPSEGAPGFTVSSSELHSLSRRALAFLDLASKGTRDEDDHSYTVELDGEEYAIAPFSLEDSFGRKHRAVLVTPTSDFVGDLQRSRRNFAIVLVILIGIEALLIVVMALRLSRGIKRFSAAIRRIREMNFGESTEAPKRILRVRELSELGIGIALLQSALRSFSLYVPLGVVRKLVDDGRPLKPGMDRRELTILFCDLENFSTLAQSISSEELLEYTTQYFTVATEAITRNGGTVDKFIGDAVMAFWGAPQEVDDHATLGCRAAVEIIRGVARLNEAWMSEGKRQLRVRVGLNSAFVLVGNIGSPDRLSYTALGDGVNIASRLEGKNKELGSLICISDSTYELAKDHVVVRPLKPVSVRGRVGEFMVYELLDVVVDPRDEPLVAQT